MEIFKKETKGNTRSQKLLTEKKNVFARLISRLDMTKEENTPS